MEDKIYVTRSSKFFDFLIGFVLIGGIFDLALKFTLPINNYMWVTPLLAAAALGGLMLSMYLYQKRKYMGIGLFSLLVCHVLAVSPYLLMLVFK
ncbi:MAG: hypothetical protein NTX59_09565 [Elusimicrobia bacterium]|nr:hypothetical protein [Elusimicrobiota bacterium]